MIRNLPGGDFDCDRKPRASGDDPRVRKDGGVTYT